MFLVGIFQWWYGEGWLRHFRLSWLGILRTADFFSLGLLIRTLVNPFRQISATSSSGPLPMQLKAFFDRLFSRVIGAVVRLIMLAIGILVIGLRIVWSGISIAVWTILPWTPVIGLSLWLIGVSL